jgi:hypothetical protein
MSQETGRPGPHRDERMPRRHSQLVLGGSEETGHRARSEAHLEGDFLIGESSSGEGQGRALARGHGARIAASSRHAHREQDPAAIAASLVQQRPIAVQKLAPMAESLFALQPAQGFRAAFAATLDLLLLQLAIDRLDLTSVAINGAGNPFYAALLGAKLREPAVRARIAAALSAELQRRILAHTLFGLEEVLP